MFCFASPQTPGGLYINLKTHQARVLCSLVWFGCLQAGIWNRAGSDTSCHQVDHPVSCRHHPASPDTPCHPPAKSQAFDEEHVDLDQERTGAVLYLHQQARRVSRILGVSCSACQLHRGFIA